MSRATPAQRPLSGKWANRAIAIPLLLLPAYGLLAYVVLPVSWRQYEKISASDPSPAITRTAEGIPGDPLNVALIGTREDIVAAMREAGWCIADRITLRSGLRDAASVLFDRTYPSAPVSTHFMWNRPQDLAFEQAAGRSPRARHHVRLWQASSPPAPERTVWLGAATFDRSVGFSRYTGEVMHHIDPNVDGEREKLFADLQRSGRLTGLDRARFRPAGRNRNGGGDWYVTDGRLCLGTIPPLEVATSRASNPATSDRESER